MMKTRIFLVALLMVSLLVVGMASAIAEAPQELAFDKCYLLLPEMDLRADPDTPGAVDTIYAGTEVKILYTKDIWAMFEYQKDGETKTGCTWVGSVGPAIRIHLLEDEFLFHQKINDRTMLGNISAWREPSDPDLLILREEVADDGSQWLYVMCLDGRCGYMRREASFEVVE